MREPRIHFPGSQPERGSFRRPLDGEELDVSPPGFCWWRVVDDGKPVRGPSVRYRLTVYDGAGKAAYVSPLLADPVHVPDRVFPEETYSWSVDALDAGGDLLDRWPSRSFRIAANATPQPWVEAEELLAHVPREHPRCVFLQEELAAVRATLNTSRRNAFTRLRKDADKGLRLTPPPEPDYDKLPDKSQRRLAYKACFAAMRKHHTGAMVSTALTYVLSGDRKYGEAAKAQLLNATEWDPEGISSILSPHGDEIGLGLAKSAALAYDWVYDLLTDEERARVKRMLVARGDQMLRRLDQRRDYLNTPGESHAGRLPGYLIEYAIALAEEPRAAVWMDYAMRVYLTVFPHWAGRDGGWAEGINYGLAYNTIYLPPFECLRRATGFDLWQRPFYRKVRTFFLYNVSPIGEVSPWGDTEHAGIPAKASGLRALMQFHALRYRDPAVLWWAGLLRDSRGRPATAAPNVGILLPEDLEPARPAEFANDAAFFGVGWAALHSHVLEPERDLMVMFKCSPFGAVSHSHADQNTFAIMKGGKALAIPAGERWPIHGSPFHTQYVQQTMSHNGILVDGKGQITRRASAGGRFTDFRSTPTFGYVAGDASACYGKLLPGAKRHVLLARPSVVVIVDELRASQPAQFEWLMHAFDKLELDEGRQQLVSRRNGEAMRVHLFTPGGFEFRQTDEWPVAPKKGYPTATAELPRKNWHFTAVTRKRTPERRIVAVMAVTENGEFPSFAVELTDGVVTVAGNANGENVSIAIPLAAGVDDRPLIRATASTGEELKVAAEPGTR